MKHVLIAAVDRTPRLWGGRKPRAFLICCWLTVSNLAKFRRNERYWWPMFGYGMLRHRIRDWGARSLLRCGVSSSRISEAMRSLPEVFFELIVLLRDVKWEYENLCSRSPDGNISHCMQTSSFSIHIVILLFFHLLSSGASILQIRFVARDES